MELYQIKATGKKGEIEAPLWESKPHAGGKSV